MPKYLVGFSESQFQEQEFKIINASSESEAVAAFIKVFAITDDTFLGDVYDRSVNASFAEHFWLQTEDEEIVFHETGEVVIDDEEFKRRVRSFLVNTAPMQSSILTTISANRAVQELTSFRKRCSYTCG